MISARPRSSCWSLKQSHHESEIEDSKGESERQENHSFVFQISFHRKGSIGFKSIHFTNRGTFNKKYILQNYQTRLERGPVPECIMAEEPQ